MTKMGGMPPEGQRTAFRLRLGLALLCVGLASGCTSQKLVGADADLTGSIKSQQSKQTELRGGDFALEDSLVPAQAAKNSQLRGTFPLASNQSDSIVTGSVAASNELIGHGDTQIERISNTISASCRRLLAEAGIESTLLRSPTINGSVNSDNDINFGASYDLLDLRRANLKEELAIVRCTRDDAAAKLTQLLVTSTQSLSQAGYRAKADHLKKSRREIAAIKRDIDRALADGDITLFRANGLRQSLQRLQSEAAQAEVEAQRRQVVRNIQGQSYVDLDRRLEKAEARIQVLQAKLRTADALKLKASVGYARRGESSDDVTISSEGEVTAKFAVSMRLGAYSRRRFELEQMAHEARAASLHEANRGILWRSSEAAKVNRSVVSSLHQQRDKLQAALAAAKSSASVGSRSFRPELVVAHLKGRIDVVRLSAEIAALDASSSDTGRLNNKLTFKK